MRLQCVGEADAGRHDEFGATGLQPNAERLIRVVRHFVSEQLEVDVCTGDADGRRAFTH
ncbi:hypothetical protein D3C86_2069340 [compost metagenome]